jgi:hypothetical protein
VFTVVSKAKFVQKLKILHRAETNSVTETFGVNYNCAKWITLFEQYKQVIYV